MHRLTEKSDPADEPPPPPPHADRNRIVAEIKNTFKIERKYVFVFIV